MPAFCFFLALGLGFSAVLFWETSQQRSVQPGHPTCAQHRICFCHHPKYLAYAGGVMLVLAIGFKLGSAME